MKQFLRISLVVLAVSILGTMSSGYAATPQSPLSPPQNIQIQVGKNHGVLLTWEKPLTKNFSGFRVYRSRKQGRLGSLVKKINKKTFFFLDEKAQSNTTYFYTVRTVKGLRVSRNKEQLSLQISSRKDANLRLPDPPEAFAMDNELEIEPVTLETSDKKIRVIIPKGYEELGQKHMQDLEYCFQIVPKFVGVTPYYDGIILKEYITKDGTGQGSGGGGVIWYARSQESIDLDLQAVRDNNPEGFLYKSGPEYCANTHEFVHNVLAYRPIPSEFNEGIAEYTQKHTQKGSKDSFECRENGWYGADLWGGHSALTLFPYNLLPTEEERSQFGGGAKMYHTALCQWELFDKKFGADTRKKVFERLNEYIWKDGVIKRGDTIVSENDFRDFNKIFIEDILFSVVGESEIKPFLEKFGYRFPLE